MIKTLTIAATAATLSAMLMTPASASPKQQPVEDKAVQFAPGQGIDIAERGRHHHKHHFKFYSYGYGYSPCYWGWKYGKKVWVCY